MLSNLMRSLGFTSFCGLALSAVACGAQLEIKLPGHHDNGGRPDAGPQVKDAGVDDDDAGVDAGVGGGTDLACDVDDDCIAGESCRDDVCQAQPCDSDGDCADSERCNATTGFCELPAGSTLYASCSDDGLQCEGAQRCDAHNICGQICDANDVGSACRAGEFCENDEPAGGDQCHPVRNTSR